MDELKADIHRVLKIGILITELSKESKELRAKIVNSIESLGLGKVNEDEYVEFVLDDNILVKVKKVKLDKDYTILTKAVPSI